MANDCNCENKKPLGKIPNPEGINPGKKSGVFRCENCDKKWLKDGDDFIPFSS